MRKKYRQLMVIGLVLVIVVGGGYVWANHYVKSDYDVLNNKRNDLDNSSKVDSSDWAKYRQGDNYEYKIPREWNTSKLVDGIYLYNVNDPSQNLTITDPVLSIEWIEGYPETKYKQSQFIDSESSITVGGNHGYLYISKNGIVTSVSTVVRFYRKGEHYVFEIKTSGFSDSEKFLNTFIEEFVIL